MNSIRQRLLIIFVVVALSLIVNATSRAASISGTIMPTHWGGDPAWKVADFGIIADTSNIVDAQSQSITISGIIGNLPENSDLSQP